MDDRTKLIQAAAVMERVARLVQELGQSNLHTVDALERTTSAVPGLLQNAAQQTLGQFTNGIAKAVHSGLNQPLDDFNRHVAHGVSHINGAMHGMTQSREELAAIIGKLRWVVIGVLAAMLLVIVAGGGVFWHYRTVIAENQLDAEFMRALNHADVRLCGNGLCARVDRTDKRYGDYTPIKPSP